MKTQIKEAVERLNWLREACAISGLDNLPVVARENAAPFAEDLRLLLSAYAQARADLEKAREALDPFANLKLDGTWLDEDRVFLFPETDGSDPDFYCVALLWCGTVADFRRAASITGGKE